HPRLRRPDGLTPPDPRPGRVPTEPGLRVSLETRPGPAFWPAGGQRFKKALTCRPRPSWRDATEHQFSLALDAPVGRPPGRPERRIFFTGTKDSVALRDGLPVRPRAQPA